MRGWARVADPGHGLSWRMRKRRRWNRELVCSMRHLMLAGCLERKQSLCKCLE